MIAIALGRTNLEHGARAAFQHGDRDGDAVGLVDLSHADFAAEQSDAHHAPSSVSVIMSRSPHPAMRPGETPGRATTPNGSSATRPTAAPSLAR